MYYDMQFARGRLVDTIIRFKNRAVVVLDVVNENQDLMIKDLESDKELVVNIDDEGVSLDPPRVGYVYIPRHGGAYYRRHPERRWKQGLPLNMFHGFHQTHPKSLGACLNGKFKSYVQCCRARMTTPFHRHWAIGSGTLYYKGEGVGTVTKEGVPSLREDKVWLKEYLEEAIR